MMNVAPESTVTFDGEPIAVRSLKVKLDRALGWWSWAIAFSTTRHVIRDLRQPVRVAFYPLDGQVDADDMPPVNLAHAVQGQALVAHVETQYEPPGSYRYYIVGQGPLENVSVN